MVGDQTLHIENGSGASLLQLQYAADRCHENGQYLRTAFLAACSEEKNQLHHALHIWRETIDLGVRTSSVRAEK